MTKVMAIGRIVGLILGCGLVSATLQAQAQTLVTTRQLPGLQESHHYLPDAPRADRIELSLSKKTVSVFRKNQILKQYPVAVGRPGWETPVGNFAIQTMIADPGWKHPFEGYVIPSGAPDNPLGKRWMGFWTNGKSWVGFHGTSESLRPSIGTAASHGCVRMYNEDIQAMFELVAVGTPVIVTP
ncbi:MAG: L,D-transpeptidase [Cyanobacteria bacterium P01_F01_bin.42]